MYCEFINENGASVWKEVPGSLVIPVLRFPKKTPMSISYWTTPYPDHVDKEEKYILQHFKIDEFNVYVHEDYLPFYTHPLVSPWYFRFGPEDLLTKINVVTT